MRFIDDTGLLSATPTGKAPWVVGLRWDVAPSNRWQVSARQLASQADGKCLGLVVCPLPTAEVHHEEPAGDSVLIAPNDQAPTPGKLVRLFKPAKKQASKAKPADSRVALGLWSLTFNEEEDLKLRRPSGARSLAAAFAQATLQAPGDGAAAAVLLWTLQEPAEKKPEDSSTASRNVYVCTVYNGQVNFDGIVPLDRAMGMVADERKNGAVVYANDPASVGLSNAAELGYEWLKNWAADKRFGCTKLRAVPVNVVALAAAGGVVVVAAGIALGVAQYRKEQRLKAEAAAAAAADPLPPYLEALANERGQAGMSASDAASLWAQLTRATPVAVPGWDLRKVSCSVTSCTASWTRGQGTFQEMAAGRSRDKLLLPAPAQGGGTTALATLESVLPVQPTASPLQAQLPTHDQYVMEAGSLYQRWANAKVTVPAIPRPQVWPATDGSAQLQGAQIVARAPFELAVDGGFAGEVLASLPAAVRITEITLDIQQGNGMNVTLKGFHYVQRVTP